MSWDERRAGDEERETRKGAQRVGLNWSKELELKVRNCL
jgi:hypothetical protein